MVKYEKQTTTGSHPEPGFLKNKKASYGHNVKRISVQKRVLAIILAPLAVSATRAGNMAEPMLLAQSRSR
jgi:hypothetical protein